jgi:hypothetical protein
MITTEGLTTTLTNGKDGVATTSVWAKAEFDSAGVLGKLVLQQLLEDVAIGDKPTPEQIEDLPKILILFRDIKSIDVYIKALEFLKSKMNGIPQYALAC